MSKGGWDAAYDAHIRRRNDKTWRERKMTHVRYLEKDAEVVFLVTEVSQRH